jgi:hypothetical protein
MRLLPARLSLRPHLSRLIGSFRGRSAPRATPLIHTLWQTYARLADQNPDCAEEPEFYAHAVIDIQNAMLEATPHAQPIAAEVLIDVIVRAISTPQLFTPAALLRIREQLTAAVASAQGRSAAPRRAA